MGNEKIFSPTPGRWRYNDAIRAITTDDLEDDLVLIAGDYEHEGGLYFNNVDDIGLVTHSAEMYRILKQFIHYDDCLHPKYKVSPSLRGRAERLLKSIEGDRR